MEGQSLPLEFLQERARLLELTVLKQRLATPDKLDTLRPGGSANPDPGPQGWCQYLLELKGIHAGAHSSLAQVYAASRTEASDQDQLDALLDRPVRIRLTSHGPDGKPLRVHAHPKALVPLLMMASLDHEVGVLTEGLALLLQETDAASVALASKTRDAIAYRVQLLAWCATTEGVGLPFAETDEDPVVPDVVKTWSAVDILLICQGHVVANQQNLAALIGLLPPDPRAQQRPTWAALVAGEASENSLPTSVVSRDRSVVSIVGRRVREARTHADARKRAEQTA